MTTVRINDFIGVEVQNELAARTVVRGDIEYTIKLMMISNPCLNRIEYATFMNGGTTVFTRDFNQAIEDFNELK